MSDSTWRDHKPPEALDCPVFQDPLVVLASQEFPHCLDGPFHQSRVGPESLQ